MLSTYGKTVRKISTEPIKLAFVHSDAFAHRMGFSLSNIKVIKVWTNSTEYELFEK